MTGEMVRGALFIGFFFFSVVFVISNLLLKWFGTNFELTDQQLRMVIAGSIALVPAAYGMWSHVRTYKKFMNKISGHMQLAREDLASGQAQVEEFKVLSIVEMEEYEDEGAGYFLELSDQRVLYVQGQDLYRLRLKKSKFPSSGIIYVTGPRSHMRLDLQPSGESLDLKGVIETSGWSEQVREAREVSGQMPQDDTFYPGAMDEVLKRLNLMPFYRNLKSLP